jgi:hypothetical protein
MLKTQELVVSEEPRKKGGPKYEGISRDVYENKGPKKAVL